jgi:hypothetical protein
MLSHVERSATVLQKISAEDRQTVSRVIAELASLSPDGSDDDVWLVWHELAKRYPDNCGYNYADPQIEWAWWVVRQARRRHDHHGAGRRRLEIARRCRRALAKLAVELEVQPVDLIGLDINDYNPALRTLTIVNEIGMRGGDSVVGYRACDRELAQGERWSARTSLRPS